MLPGTVRMRRALRTVAVGPALSAMAFAFGVISAVRLRWTCDDAFISFRYAQNLARGLGLVFNEGERVEGYTNFLWTVLMACALRLGLPAEGAAQGLGVLAFVGTLAVLLWLSRALHTRNGLMSWWPTAAAGFALHYHARVFATGGLETSLFTLLVTAGTALLVLGSARRNLAGFALFGLSALVRPEGVVFYVIAAFLLPLFSRLERKASLRELFGEQLPLHCAFLIFLLPFQAWRLYYYGDWLPNTYYAKSGGAAHYGQGFVYTGLYFGAYYVLVAAPVLILLFRKRAPDAVAPGLHPLARQVLLVGLPALALVVYYARVGGDFMFARFFVPITPLLFMAAELLMLRFLDSGRQAAAFFFVAVGSLASWNPFYGRPLPQIHGITQEHEVYRPARLAAAAAVAASWKEVFQSAGVRVAIGGAQAFVAYKSEAPFVLEGAGGLTDRTLAHSPLKERGAVVGHERKAPLAYLIKRRIHLHMNSLYVEPVPDYARVVFPLGTAAVICYDARVMDALRTLPGFEIPRFELFLDAYIRTIALRSRHDVARDYAEFRQYYFGCTKDPVRERALLNRI